MNVVGVIAIYDTHHPEYKKTNGCHADYKWVIASWSGLYNEKTKCCNLMEWQIEKAHYLLKKLNH